jgi:PAS domain S-box-containing protein
MELSRGRMPKRKIKKVNHDKGFTTGLSRSEEAVLRLAAIVESTDDAIISKTLDGIITSWNRGAESVYGYSAAEAIGSSISFLVPSGCPDDTADILNKIRSNESVVRYETVRRRKDGKEIDVSLTVSPLMNNSGEIIGGSVIGRNITKRKLAERMLRESEERYRFLFTDSQTVMLLIDPETERIADANTKASSFYGYPYEELLKLKITDLNTLPLEQVKAEMQRALTEERVYFRFQHRLANGEIRDVEVYSGPIKIDGKNLLCSVVHDETERKRMEEALRENESRLELALKSSEMGVWSLDLAENKRVFDAQVCHLLGIDPVKFSGTAKEFFSVVHPDDHDAIRSALARTIEQNAPYESDYRVVCPDGSIRHITARGALFCDDKGQAVRLNGLVWDITERKRLEEEREKLVRQLREALANVKTLSGLLPICSYCKKIRDDEGYWQQIEAYIHQHSLAQFSHGICPDCYKKARAELDNAMKGLNQENDTV